MGVIMKKFPSILFVFSLLFMLTACSSSADPSQESSGQTTSPSSQQDSVSVSSNKKVPYSTDDKVDNPVSLYAATKKSNELMAHAYSKLYNIPSTGLRFFTVYGPAGRPDMATSALLTSC